MFWKREPAVVRIRGKVTWRFAEVEPGEWVGICNELPLNAAGDTWEEASESAAEAFRLLLEDLVETGHLDAYLRAKGWALLDPMPADGRRVVFDIPRELLQASPAELQHA